MKLLTDLIKNLKTKEIKGKPEIEINNICFDSRKLERKDLFVAIKGTVADGHDFIPQAIKSGASAILCENLPNEINNEIVYIKVENTKEAMGLIASEYYNNPSSKIKLVGITGTNGKTTTATLLYKLMKGLGYKAGLLSTVKVFVDEKVYESTLTTPDSVTINARLNEMVEAGCEYCFMEVSSHAINQARIHGLKYTGAVFTNISHDHLDYHESFEEYIESKKKFFDYIDEDAFALVNNDDRNGTVMLQNCKANKYYFGINTLADYKCKMVETHFEGTLLNINNNEIWVNFIGNFNAYNMLTVYSVADLLEQDINEVLVILSKLKPVEGRFEVYKSQDNKIAIIDFAHSPDALKNVLTTINQLKHSDQQIITITGAGGNRDKTKRPLMGNIACAMSDKVIITSDNPRDEKPEQIMKDVISELRDKDKKKMLSIVDRREAIKTAFMLANENDIVLVAGKGHEKYQIIKGVKHHFDDKEEVFESFKS